MWEKRIRSRSNLLWSAIDMNSASLCCHVDKAAYAQSHALLIGFNDNVN